MSKQNELLESDNKCLTKIEQLQKYVYLYDLMYDKIVKLLKENYENEEFQNQTFLPKEFKHLK